MEKSNALIEISETASQYRPLSDEILEKSAYALIWLGSIVWLFYLANGGDIVHCFPVLICPSPSVANYNTSRERTECDKYRNMTGHDENKKISIMRKLLSLSQYQSTNIYCSKELQGYLHLTGLLLVVTGGFLLFFFRHWYLDAELESEINSFHDLVTSCAKLPNRKMLNKVIKAWKEVERNEQPSKLVTDINDKKKAKDKVSKDLIESWERKRENVFQKKLKLVDIVSKFGEEEIEQMSIFHTKMRSWKSNLDPQVQSSYKCTRVFNAMIALCFVVGVFYLMFYWVEHSLVKQQPVCKIKLRYNIVYNEIRCIFSGTFLIASVCSLGFIFLCMNFFLSIYIFIQMRRVWRPFEKHYLKFYRTLYWRGSNSCADKLVLFDNLDENCIKQIVTDKKYPLHKLDCKMGNDSDLPTYEVVGAMVPLPWCLFSETVDNQKWCLKLINMLLFLKSDFIDLDWLTGLKELNIFNCCYISCELEAHWIRKLQITSCTLQNELVISDHARVDKQNQNSWKVHNLEYLAICDPRPFKHLVLDFSNLSELLISNAAISTPLDGLPDVKILTLKFCRFKKGAVVQKTSKRLRSLTVVGCGMTDFPILDCSDLHSLDLSENCIRLVKENDDVEERGGREEEDEAAAEARSNKRQDPNDLFQKLPKLKKLVLKGNQITSSDYEILKKQLQKGLRILDVSNNPLQRDRYVIRH